MLTNKVASIPLVGWWHASVDAVITTSPATVMGKNTGANFLPTVSRLYTASLQLVILASQGLAFSLVQWVLETIRNNI